MSTRLIHGDCMVALRMLPDASVDSIVTDPPYHLTTGKKGGSGPASVNLNTPQGRARVTTGFMGMQWDGGDIAHDPAMWAECLRVLKPGGHVLAFGGSRTFHRLACAIEDAGFELRDTVLNLHEGQTIEVNVRDCPWLAAWGFGSGFPKSLDVSKAIDKAAGAEREVLAEGAPVKRMIPGADQNSTGSWIKDDGREFVPQVTAPARDAARQWEGWGTALKPAFEPIVMARKPLVGTVSENVQAFGTGALNINGCRIETDDDLNGGAYAEAGGREASQSMNASGMNVAGKTVGTQFVQPAGRWPANLLHDGSEEVLSVFPDAPGALAPVTGNEPSSSTSAVYGKFKRAASDRTGEPSSNSDNLGAVGFKMKPGARREATSAARFFYVPKASRADRHEGLEDPGPQFEMGRLPHDASEVMTAGKGNHHPTVKPTELMRYLVRLVTPPGGVVLDPFMGSGSTLKAAELEGFDGIGIEREGPYVEIARRRVGANNPLFAEVSVETAA